MEGGIEFCRLGLEEMILWDSICPLVALLGTSPFKCDSLVEEISQLIFAFITALNPQSQVYPFCTEAHMENMKDLRVNVGTSKV